jgi:low temperature requirement protein LtrA
MATAVRTRAQELEEDVDAEARVTALELFFDLVFVFAITQVTGMISGDPTWGGLMRGLLVLLVLWWAWAGYAWLTNTVDPEAGAARVVVFAAMAALMVVSLAVPGAFGEDKWVFAIAYFVVRALHIALYLVAARVDQDLLGAVKGLAQTAITGPLILIGAALFHGTALELLWVVALAIDYGGPIIKGPGGWKLSASHFTERHGLIIIIALGESIVAVGVGASGLPLDAAVIVAAVLGIAIAGAMWWAYFDVVALVAERKLRQAKGPERIAMARDSYSYIHVAMVAGIILLAVGLKKTLAYHSHSLPTVPAVCLCGGVALYLLGLVAFRLRNVKSLNRQRLLTSVVLIALIPVATTIPALAALTLVAALSVGLIAYEAIRFAEARARVRAHA